MLRLRLVLAHDKLARFFHTAKALLKHCIYGHSKMAPNSTNGLLVTFSIVPLNIKTLSLTTICHYAQCHYAVCPILFIVMLNVIILRVIMFKVVAPSKISSNSHCMGVILQRFL
jgi:hypothetical protein